LRFNPKLSRKRRLPTNNIAGSFNRCFQACHTQQPKVTVTTLYYNSKLYLSTYIFSAYYNLRL
jgi:hypothetical protein